MIINKFFLLLMIIIIIIIIIIGFIAIIRVLNKKEIHIEKFQNSSLISFMKCLFFTNKQFNTDKIHIPKQSLYIERDVPDYNLDSFINGTIDAIYQRLNRGNSSGVPVKIPAPIFILKGRKLDYDSSIFEGATFKSPYKTQFKYGSEIITPDLKGELGVLSYLNSFFNSGLAELPRDQEVLRSSLASSFKFKRNLKVIIYVPYLTNKYKYVSNFSDAINSISFFYTLLTKNNFLNFKKTSIVTYDSLKKRYKNLDDRIIRLLLRIYQMADAKTFTFYEDLQHLCLEGGCISDYGEDLTRLTTTFTDDMNQNNEEAIKKSPYVPSKCLAQTKGYKRNIRDIEKNLDLPEFLKKFATKEIGESLNKYIEISDKISRGDNNIGDSEESKKIADYSSPVDLIISILNSYIKKGYEANLNDGDRDGIKLNHYSKDYSRNIIKELSLLNKTYPGIPEIVMSLYIFDENQRPDRFIYHPWGRKLISSRNVLKLGDIIPADKSIFSFNNRFAMTINRSGFIYTYDRYSGQILYFLNRNPIPNTENVSITTTGIVIEYVASDNNKKSQNLKLPNGVKTLVGNCDECKREPFNLILNDGNGSIVIYANSFYETTSSEFRNYMNEEIRNGQRLNMNINDANFNDLVGGGRDGKGGKPIEIGMEEDYVFCSDKDSQCRK